MATPIPATREALAVCEADCTSAADFATLARGVVAVDAEHAKSLPEKAESQCQMPADYIAAAVMAALEDQFYARPGPAPASPRPASAPTTHRGDPRFTGPSTAAKGRAPSTTGAR